MKKYPIKGADVLLYIGNDLIAGQRNTTVDITADSIETTSKDNDGWKTYLAGLREWSATLDAIELGGDEGKQQVQLMKAILEGTPVEVKIVVPGKFVMSGAAAITSKSTSGDYSDVSLGSYELKGADAPDISYVPFIDTMTASGTSVTIRLTETEATTVDGKVLKDYIEITDGTTAATISNASISSGTITVTVSASLTASTKYTATIAAGTLKNGDAVQANPISASATATA